MPPRWEATLRRSGPIDLRVDFLPSPASLVSFTVLPPTWQNAMWEVRCGGTSNRCNRRYSRPRASCAEVCSQLYSDSGVNASGRPLHATAGDGSRCDLVDPGRVVERPVVEVETARSDNDGRLDTPGREQRRQRLSDVAASGVGVADQGDGQSSMFGVQGDARGDVVVGCLRAKQGDRSEPGLRGCERVGQPFADKQNVGRCMRGCDGECQPRVRRNGCRRVVVLAARFVRVEVSGLDVGDVSCRVERGKGRGDTGAVWQAALAAQQPPRRVGTDAVRLDGFVVNAALMQPFAYRSTNRPVEHAAANVDIVLDQRIHHLRRRSLSRRFRMDRWERLIWDQPGPVGEPIDGVSATARTGDHHEIDGVAAVIAGPASPTLVASMIAVQRDRRSVVVVVGRGAMPASARAVALGGLVNPYR